ncbi:MAG: XTP/dITP diphosphatase [Bacillales bacterium]|jgi:XTP/dITP diphosphohydrolase|nr:XTP/dITP diphosphatase [Bacillales bacterium]
MKKILVATNNVGKAREFKELLEPLGFQVLTNLDLPEPIDVEETGSTFEENAFIKARAISELMGIPVIADDSGLIVDALDGRPGVYSARYAGEPTDDVQNYEKVLAELGDLPLERRTARFYCCIVFVGPGLPDLVTEGTVEGRILFEPIGSNGFGYNPIFFVDEFEKSLAQCTSDEKNAISHRAIALKKMIEKLNKLTEESGAILWQS